MPIALKEVPKIKTGGDSCAATLCPNCICQNNGQHNIVVSALVNELYRTAPGLAICSHELLHLRVCGEKQSLQNSLDTEPDMEVDASSEAVSLESSTRVYELSSALRGVMLS